MSAVEFYVRDGPTGFLTKLRDFYNAGDHLEWAAIYPGGKGWVIIPRSGKPATSGPLPAALQTALTSLQANNAKITRVFFNKDGVWSAHNDRGAFQTSTSMSADTKTALTNLNNKGKIVSLSFTPDGAWFAVNENGGFDSRGTLPETFFLQQGELSKGQNRLVCVAFTPSGTGWTMISNTGGYFNWNMPPELHMAMGYFGEVYGGNQFACYDALGTAWTVAARITRSEAVTDNGKTVKILDVYKNIQQTLDGNCVGYACIISKDVLGSFSAGFARTSTDGPAQRFLPSTKINLCSGSKVLTAITAIKLLDEKGVDLKDTIGNHLPKDWTQNMTQAAKNISFWNLLAHHSGIKEQGTNETYDNLKAFYSSLGSTATTKQWIDDKKYRYSNWNFAIFRVLLPLIDGWNDWFGDFQWSLAARYISLVNKYVFAPVGVKGIDTEPPSSGPQADKYALAYPYPFDGKGINHNNGTKVAGGGSWWISLEDIVPVLLSLRNDDGRILSPSQNQDMTAHAKYPHTVGFLEPWPEDPDPTDPSIPYARLGWDNTQNDGTTRWIQKNGGLPANSTSMAFFGGDILGCLLINSEIAPPNHQPGWRWCLKCQAQAFITNSTGTCAAGGQHDHSQSLVYFQALGVAPANSQPGWRWCRTCQGLSYINGPKLGKCSATGKDHDHQGSGQYHIVQNLPKWPVGFENNWGYCKKCQVLAYTRNTNKCAEGGSHDFSSSGDYGLRVNIGADSVLYDAYQRAMK